MKKIFAKKTGEFRVSIFDLLNNNSSYNQSIGDNYIEISQSNVLQRLYMLSLMYSFNRMGK